MKHVFLIIFVFLLQLKNVYPFEVNCPYCDNIPHLYDKIICLFDDCLKELDIKSKGAPDYTFIGIDFITCDTVEEKKLYLKNGWLEWKVQYYDYGFIHERHLFRDDSIECSNFCFSMYSSNFNTVRKAYVNKFESESFSFRKYGDTLKAFSAINSDLLFLYNSEIEFNQTLISEKENDLKLLADPEYLISPFGPTKQQWIESLSAGIQRRKENLNIETILYNTKLTKYYEYRGKIENQYRDIYNRCIENHRWIGSYYQRGLLNFDNGYIINTLYDIRKIIENSESLEDLVAQIYLLKGQTEVELGLYHDAIASLSEAIQKDPENKEIYFERAQAYFELGQFDLAIKDYIASELKISSINPNDFSKLNFAKGLISGIMRGSAESAVEFVPSILSTVQGLENGLWSFVTDPVECSREMVESCGDCINFIKDNSSKEILETLVPEMRNLIEGWDTLADEKKGELFGYVVGKYGIDIFLTAGSVKAVKYYRDLKKANAMLTLETLSKDAEAAQTIKEASDSLNKKHLETIEKFKAAEAALKPYQGQYLSEMQIRKILHQAGLETFPRPKGIPDNFRVKLSDSGGGMKYVHPEHTDEFVRVMPGKPHSPNPCQQKPYVEQMKDGKAYDKFGNKVSRQTPEAHIPLDEYNYIEK